jgi:hypothetical protein
MKVIGADGFDPWHGDGKPRRPTKITANHTELVVLGPEIRRWGFRRQVTINF